MKFVQEMKDLAQLLIPYTYPLVSVKEEYDILPLKYQNITIDGYDIIVTFSIADYDKYLIETLQIQSAFTYFLPFVVVCKLVKMFLGSKHLIYTDFIKGQKKIYCWSRKLRHGKVIKTKNKLVDFEGFEYTISRPGAVKLHES